MTIFIAPSSWLCRNIQSYDPSLHLMTPIRYLWHRYRGSMQRAPEPLLYAWFYDNCPTTTAQAYRSYRNMQKLFPLHDGLVPIDTFSHFSLQHLRKDLARLGLWDNYGILCASLQLPPVQGIGFTGHNAHLPWIEPIHLVHQPVIYRYNDNDALWMHVNKHAPDSVLILAQEDVIDTVSVELTAHAITFSHDTHNSLQSAPTIIKLHAWFDIDRENIQPRQLADLLLDHQNPQWGETIALLENYPHTLCTYKQLEAYLMQRPTQSTYNFLSILSTRPQASDILTVEDFLLSLKNLHTALLFSRPPYWEQFLENISCTQLLKKRRSLQSWIGLSQGLIAIMSAPSQKKYNVQLAPMHTGLNAYAQHIYIPEHYHNSPPRIPEGFSISQSVQLLEKYKHESSLQKEKYTTYLAHSLPLSPVSTASNITFAPRPEYTLPQRNFRSFSWIKSLLAYTLCPRLGWLTEHITPPSLPQLSILGLNPSAKGRLLHEWMCHTHSAADLFLDTWLKSQHHHLHEAERSAWIQWLTSIAQAWDMHLTAHPWMRHLHSQEQSIELKRHSFKGHVRIDLVLKHPKGLVVIDFKTSAKSLNPLTIHAGLAPQLPVYKMALGDDVIAVAYAVIKEDSIQFLGLSSEDIGLFPQTHNPESWQELSLQWLQDIDSTLACIHSAQYTLTPFTPHHSCETCTMRNLCKPH